MRRSTGLHQLSKVFYRPIEAAIRWSELLRYERQILRVHAGVTIGASPTARWPELQLNFDRIIDGIRNKELPASLGGVTADTILPPIDHPELVVRHVDLKVWMTQFYPESRPLFLFGPLERNLKPVISVEAVHALLVERELLKAQLEQLRARDRTQGQLVASTSEHTSRRVPSLDTRGETTHLNILGCLLNLMLGSSPSGQPYSAFRSQEAIINAMVAENGDRLGISERTLKSKFAAARRALNR